MFQEGMIIKTFPDTDVHAYVRWIRENGFKADIYRDYIRVGKRRRNDIDRNEMARLIRTSRKARKLTREELSIRLGVSVDSVYAWEKGERIPRLSTLKDMGDFFGWDCIPYC